MALPYFPTLPHKWHDLKKKSYCIWYVCFDFLYDFCLKWFLILRIIQQDIIINVHRSSCKVPVSLVRFSWNMDFLKTFLKNTCIPNAWKTIHCEPSSSVWTDGRTWWSKCSLVTILQTCLQTAAESCLQKVLPKIIVWHCSDYRSEFTMSNTDGEIKWINNFQI